MPGVTNTSQPGVSGARLSGVPAVFSVLASVRDIAYLLVIKCTPSPTVGLQGLRGDRDPCDLPLESLRICEEGWPCALTHRVGKDFLVARDDARDNCPGGVGWRSLVERQGLGHPGVNRAGIHA